MFRFKQFSVDQTGCAMKINTDGVLLGALVEAVNPESILDIGTGTGVIALMLAQRFETALIDAVEIDEIAAATAARNFNNSSFKERLAIHPKSFASFFDERAAAKYDLIVSNPPFFIDQLKSPKNKINLAKHTDKGFFEQFLYGVSSRLTPKGACYLILPIPTALLVKELVVKNGLFVRKTITIHSFDDAAAHREILAIGTEEDGLLEENFVIYSEVNKYSKLYQEVLKDFLTIF